MTNAPKLLQKEVDKINAAKEKTQKSIDNPEMTADYEFAMNDMANLETLEIEYLTAMDVLMKYRSKTT